MAPFRSFLSRRAGTPNSGELNTPPVDTSRLSSESHRSNPLSFRKSHESNEPHEYKLSVVDVNGDYLPPSPPEKESFWHRYPGSNRSSNHRNLVDENEPFSISRESFDSYRRSFDISARSPINYSDGIPSRTSLDSRVSRLTSFPGPRRSERPENLEEDCFEDVGLDDDVKPKKRGLFSRLGDLTGDNQGSGGSKSSSHLGFHIHGRKRGQSGAGSELGAMKSPPAPEVSEVHEA